MELTDHIRVVGAGQSGIMAATRLRELGFTRIGIPEAGPKPGGYCQTAEIDGATYDFQAPPGDTAGLRRGYRGHDHP